MQDCEAAYEELGNQGIKATDIPVVAFSVGEEELAGRVHRDRRDGAEHLLVRITEIAPGFVAAWHDVGSVLKELNRFEEAVKALQEAVRLDPANAVTHYFYGAALAMAAQPEAASGAIRAGL